MVETIPIEIRQHKEVFCGKVKIRYNPCEKAKQSDALVKKYIASNSVLFSDKALNYTNFSQLIDIHISYKSNHEDKQIFKWINVVIANLKRSILGIYHCIKESYLQNYLDEFNFKFNRRHSNQVFELMILNSI